ncbi:MAG TPA: hypothetical protein VFT06_14695, partial [Flavisolibacter sp.]|nr:hypothetical protein [Flavisolibacter sp.]
VTYVSDGKLTDTAINPGYKVPSAKNLIPKNSKGNLFYEQDGYVSLEAEHWTRAVNASNVKWKVIPDIGRTGSGITTFPVTTSTSLSATSPHVEYDFYTLNNGAVKLDLYFSPTLNFHNNEGLQFAVSIDDEKPQVFSLNKDDNNGRVWNNWAANNMIIKNSSHTLAKAGRHTLKYWMISPAVVLQKLVVDLGGAKPSYLGPPETKQ